MSDERKWHILRLQVPWRRGALLTECGMEDDRALTAEETLAKTKELGQQRMAMLTCMTCWGTVQRYRFWDDGRVQLNTWADDPVAIMDREVNRSRWGGPKRAPSPLKDELVAIALLIEAHRDEFDELLGGLGDVENLATLRAAKAYAKRSTMR